MDNFEGSMESREGKHCRKKRSNLYRRPQNDSHSPPDYCVNSSMSSTLPSDSQSKASSGDNFDLGVISGASYTNLNETESYQNAGVKEIHEFYSKDDSLGMHPRSAINDNLATATLRGVETSGRIASDVHSRQSGVLSHGVESKVKKVKLKLGGVSRTIHTSSGAGYLLAKSSSSSAPHQHHKDSSDKGIVMQGIPWKDFSKSGFSFGRSNSSGDIPLKQFAKYKPACKNKHISKRSQLGEYNTEYDDDDDDDDDEIRYLEKLRTSKVTTSHGGEYDEAEAGSKKLRKMSIVLNKNDNIYGVNSGDYSSLKTFKDSKKSKSVREFEDTDYVEEEESLCDAELRPRMKHCNDLTDISGSAMTEMAMTTRQRAHQTGKEVSSLSSLSAVEFHQGLPPSTKKQKEQLSEVEQQLKKAEAAQRRRIQAEKAARESEAEAIRKILGQDSSRKKRELKLKKRQEESAQERNAKAAAHPSNAIRWILGPSGTVVSFPIETGLPSIFEPKACSYPPPRERCAGPSCTNAYKYRDSKSKLSLCSL